MFYGYNFKCQCSHIMRHSLLTLEFFFTVNQFLFAMKYAHDFQTKEIMRINCAKLFILTYHKEKFFIQIS